MKSKYLMDTEWLERHLGDKDLRIFDCTVHITADPKTGLSFKTGLDQFEKGHVPGAGFLDMIEELSDRGNKFSFTLPPAEQFAAAISQKGVSDDSRVVLYSTESYQWATRVWWLFRVFGFDNVAVLDGGWQKWSREGRPVSTEASSYVRGIFTPRLRPELVANKEDVLAVAGTGDACVISALPPQMYSGESPINFGRKGHIAGSVNLWLMDLVDPETNEFLLQDLLKEKFNAVGALVKDRVITYCGKGVSATADAFALTLLGHEGVAVYDGSMEEWARDPALPMEEGDG